MTMMEVIRYAGGGTGQAKREGRPSAASSTSRVSLTLASFPPARPRLQHLYFDLELGAPDRSDLGDHLIGGEKVSSLKREAHSQMLN